MAESVIEEVSSNSLTNFGNSLNLDCAVCLQTCIHPAELPCGHIFCYLCIKGIVNQGRRCAMCRQEIPVDYLDKPTLVKPMDAEGPSQGFEDGHLWFYEGHNGWWQYDDRTSVELESAYQKGERCCEVLIAGFLYVVDFDGMLQYRRNDPSRRRRIKRDIATTNKKGIAGLKATKNCSIMLSNTPENVPNEINQNLPVSNSPALNDYGVLRNLNSVSNSSQHAEVVQSHQRTTEDNSTEYFPPICRTTFSSNSNLSPAANSSRSNYDLDSTIQNTLDWAIEQIESLNLELLNDYETIFRDYGQAESNLHQIRHNGTPSNHKSRYPIVSNTPNESLENVLESTPVLGSDDGVSNTSFGVSSAFSDRTNPSVVNELDIGASQPTEASPPQPPPRNRGMPRSGRDFSLRSSNLNCDRFFQRFVSNK